jgi:hypothetical protein
MNKRIRELMIQSNPHGDFKDCEWVFEKFAELIIRECMKLLEDYTTDVNVGGIQYNVLSADETLQKHFGIEE